ncbi:MAG: DUF362 domain-containing protein [Syntrophaceae bacterium]
MKRRDFLKLAAAAGIGTVIPEGLFSLAAGAAWAAAAPDLVVAQGNAAPGRIVRAAVEGCGGIRKFISRGDIVVVKPNIGWDRRPEMAANTNPEVVAEIVKLCLEAGARKVKVFDNPVNDARRCYKQSGISDAAAKAGAEVKFMDERKFKDVKLQGAVLKSWPLYTEALEADKFINVPIAKTHGLAGLTLSLKNMMGVMGGSRGRIHQNLDESLLDVAGTVRPALTILDAIRVLTANGPQGGSPADVKEMNTIVAGIDMVAVDAYGATLFGRRAADLGCVRAARRRNFGKADLMKMNIRKVRA